MSGGLPASADSEVDRVARLIEEVAPDATLAQEVRSRSRGFTAPGANHVTTIPATAGGTVSLEAPNGGTLEIGLPQVADGAGRQASDGTVIYQGDQVDVAVQATREGARILTILKDRNSPERFEYTFNPGLTPIVHPGGTVSLGVRRDGYFAQVAVAGRAWAKDANGRDVPTRYEVEGDTLVQVIDHMDLDIAYPVVADPPWSFTYGVGVYVWFDRAMTKTIATAGWAASGAAAACAAAGMALGGPGGAAAMGAACLAYASTIVVTAGYAENSSPKRCLMLNWTPVLGMRKIATYAYKSSGGERNCR